MATTASDIAATEEADIIDNLRRDYGIEIDPEKGYAIVTPEQGRRMFDAAARKQMGISGEEFIRRWDAGEYKEIADKDGHRHIMDLALMISFGRQDS